MPSIKKHNERTIRSFMPPWWKQMTKILKKVDKETRAGCWATIIITVLFWATVIYFVFR